MQVFAHEPLAEKTRAAGLIVLQTDERVEPDMRRLLPPDLALHVSRVPSGAEVTPDSLAEMERHLTGAAALLPPSAEFGAIGYACTSGSAQIGPDRVARQVRKGAAAQEVTNPVSALCAACAALGLKRLALLSPYVASVSDRLRAVLAGAGVETPVFASFDVAEEARVIRIAPEVTISAVTRLLDPGGVDGVFLSCTNLDTLDTIAPLEARFGLPVLSSNLVLAWHIARLMGRDIPFPSKLTRATHPETERPGR